MYMKALNPNVKIECFEEKLSQNNALRLFKEY